MEENKNYHERDVPIHKALICDQTALINYLVEHDPDGTIRDDVELLNYSRYKAELSDGGFLGTYDELTKRRIKVEEELEILQSECNRSRSGNPSLPIKGEILLGEISRLENDLDRLENPKYIAKDVLEWWLIPFWLSQKLLDKGEVILQVCRSSWWGRTSFTPIENDAVLTDITIG